MYIAGHTKNIRQWQAKEHGENKLLNMCVWLPLLRVLPRHEGRSLKVNHSVTRRGHGLTEGRGLRVGIPTYANGVTTGVRH